MRIQIPEPAIRRILVAVDASTQSLAALEEAVNLASATEAELVGIFVEDINLVRIARMPFARQILFPSGTEEPLDSSRMDRELRAVGEAAQKAMARATGSRKISWSFHVVRGQVTAELLAAASDADLLILGRQSWIASRRKRFGSTALAIIEAAPAAALLTQEKASSGQSILVVYDGSPLSQRALKIATLIASTRYCPITVVIPAATKDGIQSLTRKATDTLGNTNLTPRFYPVQEINPQTLAAIVRRFGGALLVLPESTTLSEKESLLKVLEEIDNPVLLIGQA